MTSHEQPPFDETTQWSGANEGDRRDPIALGEVLSEDPVAQQAAIEQVHAQVRVAEAELAALLDDHSGSVSNEQILAASENLARARAQEEALRPDQE